METFLLVLSVNDLLFSADTKRVPEPKTGVVPLGVPLFMGPAALTRIICLVHCRYCRNDGRSSIEAMLRAH